MHAPERIALSSGCFKTPGSTSKRYFIPQQNKILKLNPMAVLNKLHSEGELGVAYMFIIIEQTLVKNL